MIKGLIFNSDGVMIDSAGYPDKVWKKTADKLE
jgi:beta-phosphoglucomutase-like phosphatase (HAD superfamily)